MVVSREQIDVGDVLARLAGALEAIELGPDAPVWSAQRDRLATSIRSYLIPRAQNPSVPVTVVIAGPTGSGKSTLMNSLYGRDVSRTGVLRPTTQRPLVLAGPQIADDHRLIGDVECDVVEGEVPDLESLVLIDAPDFDSTSTGHRAVAETLVDNADIVVFVTSALRYSDEVPWQVLRRAISRGARVLHVLNRVGSPSAGAVLDFRSRLRDAGLDDDIIIVPEHHLTGDAEHVPPLAVRSLRSRLAGTVANREKFAARVVSRVLRSTIAETIELAGAIGEHRRETMHLYAELSVSLADRVSKLDLEDVAVAIRPVAPERAWRWSVRRWRRRASRVDSDEMKAAELRLADDIVSLVRADIGRWLAGERRALRDWSVEPSEVMLETLAMARSRIETWIRFVARIAADHDGQASWLREAVLLDAATAASRLPEVEMLFGAAGHELVDRARRELLHSVELIDEDVAHVVVGAITRRRGLLDDRELRASLGAVTSLLAPAYA